MSVDLQIFPSLDPYVKSAKPFIKWAGGKHSVAHTLIDFFPKFFMKYYEPFLGGGSLFFALSPQKAILSDENKWLIDTYIALKNDWKKVTHYLEKMVNNNQEFLKIRSIDPWTLDLFERAAQFIFLNKTCFRGLFRVNSTGRFNVPYGAYNRRYYDSENLEAVASMLTSAEIKSGDFELGIDGVKERDFVYFDPPYYKLGGYSDFNRYTPKKFKEKDHFRLAAICRELDAKGIKWAVSNSNTEFVKALFSGFQIHHVSARREINLDSQSRNVVELLITNYKVSKQ
ncbi:MAG: Dam family site-specific DNA-(adenine-N6)-methyltransferase [Chlamydiae bacterium]|nr:Dam family site-specific DNA-(adenine-N6)-methyltransferase [Chlamydiota bacterium]